MAPWLSTRRAHNLLKLCSEAEIRVPPAQSSTAAEQLASALYATHLLDETGNNLHEVELLNRQLIGTAWQEYGAARQDKLPGASAGGADSATTGRGRPVERRALALPEDEASAASVEMCSNNRAVVVVAVAVEGAAALDGGVQRGAQGEQVGGRGGRLAAGPLGGEVAGCAEDAAAAPAGSAAASRSRPARPRRPRGGARPCRR